MEHLSVCLTRWSMRPGWPRPPTHSRCRAACDASAPRTGPAACPPIGQHNRHHRKVSRRWFADRKSRYRISVRLFLLHFPPWFKRASSRISLSLYIYIYIYMYTCNVCVCVFSHLAELCLLERALVHGGTGGALDQRRLTSTRKREREAPRNSIKIKAA
jgi:hypothetical protein